MTSPGSIVVRDQTHSFIISPKQVKLNAFHFGTNNGLRKNYLEFDSKAFNITPKKSVLITFTLKEDFAIPLQKSKRSKDLCSQIAYLERLSFENQFFGPCQFTIANNSFGGTRDDMCFKQCQPNFLFETVEHFEIGFPYALHKNKPALEAGDIIYDGKITNLPVISNFSIQGKFESVLRHRDFF